MWPPGTGRTGARWARCGYSSTAFQLLFSSRRCPGWTRWKNSQFKWGTIAPKRVKSSVEALSEVSWTLPDEDFQTETASQIAVHVVDFHWRDSVLRSELHCCHTDRRLDIGIFVLPYIITLSLVSPHLDSKPSICPLILGRAQKIRYWFFCRHLQCSFAILLSSFLQFMEVGRWRLHLAAAPIIAIRMFRTGPRQWPSIWYLMASEFNCDIYRDVKMFCVGGALLLSDLSVSVRQRRDGCPSVLIRRRHDRYNCH